MAWRLLSRSSAFFSFPPCSQEQHWLYPGSLPCFPCWGLPGAKTSPDLSSRWWPGETQPSPRATPCTQGPRRTFLKPPSPNTKRNSAASCLGFLGLAFNSSCFKERPNQTQLVLILSPIVKLVVSGSRGSYVYVFMLTGTQRVLSLAGTTKQTHVHM